MQEKSFPGTAKNNKNTRTRMPPAMRRQQILEAAIKHFSENGFEGSTRALVKEIGVTQPLIYRYFSSKEGLIREVYNEIYVNRWQPAWEQLIADQTIPLRQRLIEFYTDYTKIIFTPEWVRIYLFAGLRGVGINHWWSSFVEEHLLRSICREVRLTYGLPSVEDLPIQPAELEFYWLYHGGIFYYGVRRFVYKVPQHMDLPMFITYSVDSFLSGLPGDIRRIIDQ